MNIMDVQFTDHQALREAWGVMSPAARLDTLRRLRELSSQHVKIADYLEAAYDVEADIVKGRLTEFRNVPGC
jgi:hypothetical protein